MILQRLCYSNHELKAGSISLVCPLTLWYTEEQGQAPLRDLHVAGGRRMESPRSMGLRAGVRLESREGASGVQVEEG